MTVESRLIAIDQTDLLGILSSSIHEAWALAAGSRLGIGNDPRYNNSLCFDSFAFPAATPENRQEVVGVMERLHQHREEALARDEAVTITGMYNVVEKLRTGEELSDAERQVHELAACGILRDLHTSWTPQWRAVTAGRGRCQSRRSLSGSRRSTTSDSRKRNEAR
jgi:hypothetical protein